MMVRIFDLRAFVGLHLRRTGWRGLAAALLTRLRKRMRRLPARNPAVAISTQSRFDARFDELWTVASEGFDFIADRGAGYLNWRYGDPAGGDSLLRVATLGEELIGYAVLKLSGDLPLIADLLVRPGHESALSVMLADALSQARRRDLRQLACPLPGHHPYRAALLESGFQDAGGDYRFQYRPHGTQPERLAFLGSDPEARIHVTIGDFDYV